MSAKTTTRKKTATPPHDDRQVGDYRLNDREHAAMIFAARAFKEPWLNLVDLQARLEHGEKVDFGHRQVDPFLLPVKLDAQLARWALKLGGAKLMIGQNPNMLSLVLNEQGDRLIWAMLEDAESGTYTEAKIIKHLLHLPWARQVAAHLHGERLEDAYETARRWAAEHHETAHIPVGLIKVAHIQFFEAFQEAWENADDGQNVAALLLGYQRVVHQVTENNWLRFYPSAGLDKLLHTAHPLLKLTDGANRALLKLAGAKPAHGVLA